MTLSQLFDERNAKVSLLIHTVASLKLRGRWVHQVVAKRPKNTVAIKQNQRFNEPHMENDMMFNQAPPIESKQRFFGADTNDEDQSLVFPSNIAEEAKMKKKFAPDGYTQN